MLITATEARRVRFEHFNVKDRANLKDIDTLIRQDVYCGYKTCCVIPVKLLSVKILDYLKNVCEYEIPKFDFVRDQLQRKSASLKEVSVYWDK